MIHLIDDVQTAIWFKSSRSVCNPVARLGPMCIVFTSSTAALRQASMAERRLRSRLFQEGVMPAYRVYPVTPEGQVAGPPHVLDCADDQEAIRKAAQYTNGMSVELWDGARFIVRFPSDDT